MKHFLQKYEIFIGDSADYSQNTKVPGGPFLDPELQSTYAFDSYANYYTSDNFGKGTGLVWRYGMENWVNKEG